MDFARALALTVLAAAGFGLAAGPAGAADDLLERIKERGVLRACTVNYTPWNLKDPIENRWEGINIELTEEIAGALDVDIEWVDAAWATVIQSVQTDKCDIAVAALWTAPARAEVVSFTRPIGGDGMTLFVPEDAEVSSFEDLDEPGNVITVLSGSADERVANKIFQHAEVRSLVTDQLAAQVLEVATGRADGAFGGFAGNAQFLVKNPHVRVKPLPELMINYTPFAFAVPAREYFFRDYVNVVLGNLEASGKLEEIKNRWTGVGN